MASSTPLHLFPTPPSSTQLPPRKSSLKPRPSDVYVAPGELKGVAFSVTTSRPNSPPVIQPGNDHIKHSLFCEPEAKSDTTNRGPLRRGQRARRRSSEPSSSSDTSPPTGSEATSTADDDKLSPLPQNTYFGSTSPRRNAPSQLKRPGLPKNISTEAQADTETPPTPDGDRLSPLPSKDRFLQSSPTSAEYPAPLSVRSGSPTLVRSNSAATSRQAYNTPTMKSIFPQYDPSRTLSDQQYYPSARSPGFALPSEKINKFGSPDEKKHAMESFDTPIATVVNGYEHIPVANSSDLSAVWNASCGHFPVAGRKMSFGLFQPRNQGTSLAIGVSQDELLYIMGKDSPGFSAQEPNPPMQLNIKKCCRQSLDISPVAQLDLPDSARPKKERENDVVTIFPQMAAIHAIEAASNSPAAAAIATFDPKASSPEAKRLAQDAVSEAHARHRCQLVRAIRKRDSLGAVTAMYNLEHPLLGEFPITITKSTAGGRHSKDPRAKISLHHPSATPAAVMAETLVLAFMDFARDACVLDTPGLLALEGPYVIDTVICAVLAVATIENDALMTETLTFDAPPTSPLPTSKRKSRSKSPQSDPLKSTKRSSRFWGRSRKLKKVEEEQVELPVLTQGALAILGLSFKTAVWVLEAGVKVTAGLVIGVTHLASKA